MSPAREAWTARQSSLRTYVLQPRYHPGVSRSGQEILAICRLRLVDEEAEALVGWLASRLGRPLALAGDRPAHQRLEHVVVHWLSEGQRSALLAWLARRAALGKGLVPGRRGS
jgi:hypothetical protein